MKGRATASRDSIVPKGTIARPLSAPVRQEVERDFTSASEKSRIAEVPGTRGAEREADAVAKRTLNPRKTDAEPRFDFSTIRIHANALSPSESRAANASAIAHGRDIYFAEGRFAPTTPQGKSLLAHELTHVVQQGKSGITLPQRKTPDEEIDEALKAQTSDPKRLDPDNEGYAQELSQLGATLTKDKGNLIPKPAKKAEIAAWELRFTKLGILADRALAAGPHVTDKESRAAMMGLDLAEAGFIDKAMEIGPKIADRSERVFIYDAVLKQPSGMSVAHATLLAQFYIAGAKKLADNAMAKAIEDHTGDYAKALGNDKLNVMFKLIVSQYDQDPDIVEFISHVLVFNPGARATLSATMTSLGKTDLLFKVLRGPYFADDDQPDPRKVFGVGNTTTPKTLTATDQAWAVGQKQTILINRVIALAAAQKITIPKPTSMAFATIRSWLDANTENIGKAIAAGSADDAAQMYRDMADTFFWHVPIGVDVAPDLHGKVAKLTEGDPQKSRLRSDCDVLASYAMRLLTSSGLTPVGYMAIKPAPGRDAHALALMTKGTTYFAISNKTIEKLDSSKIKKVDDALPMLRDYGFTEAYDTPKPSSYQIFWQPTGADGVLDQKLIDYDPSFERTDLEPKSP